MLDIVTYGHESLRAKALPVTEFDAALEAFVEEMYVTMREGKGIGLAATQVARPLRLFVTWSDGDRRRVFINPEIILTSTEMVEYEEGCLSLPRLYTDVLRPEQVKIQAYNEKGRPFTLEADGLLARVIQHEYDHLDGVLFIDRLTEARRERALAQYSRLSRS